jgi:hypothetical protein
LAKELKTPENIYNFVVNTLSYNQDKATPNSQRMGAIMALENKDDVICTEFTDLFIAISRAAGIPAREINGYAYTENPNVKPISLVADILHSWPEYFDYDRKVWIPVDPTWGSTSGINYFDNLDLRHITFVIHGEHFNKPYPPGSYKLGDNPQKDVHVSFAQNNNEYFQDIEININSERSFIFNISIDTSIKNVGNIAAYNLSPMIFFNEKLVKSDFVNILPPFSTYKNNYNLSFKGLNGNNIESVTFKVSDKSKIIDVNLSIINRKNIVIIILLFSTITLIILYSYKFYNKRKLEKYELFK